MQTALRTAGGKRLPLFSLYFILLILWCNVGQGQLVGYDVSTQTNYGVSPLNPSLVASNVVAGGLTKGSGVVNTTGTAATGGWGGTGWNYSTPDAAIAANAFFTFTIKVNTGYLLSLAAFNEFDYRRSASGPDSALIQYAINNGTFTDISTTAFTSTSNTGASLDGISLSGVSALQNLPAGSIVTFRIVPFGASISSGTFYIYSKNGTTDPDLSLAGTINNLIGATFYSKSYGNLNLLSSWGTNPDGSGNAPVSFTADNQIFNIQNKSAATINGMWTVSGVNSKIVVGDWSSAVSFTIPSTYAVNGLIDVASYGTLILKNTTIPNLGALAANSTVNYNGSSTQIISAKTYKSLAINNSSGVILTGSVTVGDALRLTNGTLDIAGNTLTITGYVSSKGTGTLSCSPVSNINIGGNVGTLNFTPAFNSLNSLIINAGASASLGNALNIAAGNAPGTLTVNGTLITNGFLTIKSDAFGTARIGTSTGTISGDITVERFIPAKPMRKWTFIASPVSTSIRNGWQQRIFITGLGKGGRPCGNSSGNGGSTDKYNSNGFDDTQNDPATIFTYEPTLAAGSSTYFTPVNNTDVLLTPGGGYRVNIRGNRNTPNACATQINYYGNTPPADSVTLSVTGAYTQTANKVLNFPSNKFTLVGNPYPSELSLKAVFADNSSVINAKAWLYCGNPVNTGDVYTVVSGGQLTNGEFLPKANKIIANGTLTDVVISSGEAFFVEANAAGSIRFIETQKATVYASGNNIYSRQKVPFTWTNYTRIHLMKEADSLLEMDNIIVRYKNGNQVSNTVYGALDAASLNAAGSSIASLKAGSRMAIQTRRLDFLKRDTIWLSVDGTTGNYRVTFTEYGQFVKAKYIYLIDNYRHLTINVKQQSGGYPFTITADSLSKGNRRFMVVFSTTPMGNNNTANERSTAAQAGLYPNPVHSLLHINVQCPDDLHYQLKLLSATGAVMMVKEGNIRDSNIALSVIDLAKGTYIADLFFANGKRYTQKFIKQ